MRIYFPANFHGQICLARHYGNRAIGYNASRERLRGTKDTKCGNCWPGVKVFVDF